jgi:hypothetical protein
MRKMPTKSRRNLLEARLTPKSKVPRRARLYPAKKTLSVMIKR